MTEREKGPTFEANTIVSDAVDVDPAVVDRLAALNPLFERLRDPDQCRLLGSHVTLSDAAAIAGTSLTDVLRAVNARTPAACAAHFRETPEEETPAWMTAFPEGDAAHLDVRPMIAENREPFSVVMTAAAAVPPGGSLVIEAPFNPLPLRDVLHRKGFSTYARRMAENHWRIFCGRDGRAAGIDSVETKQGAKVWRADDAVHIDVRHLEAPAPLVAILALIDGPDHGGRVIVHHSRAPLYLFPELVERGWIWRYETGEPDEVRLHLRSSSVTSGD